MYDFTGLLLESLKHGSALSVLLGVVVLASLFYNPEIWVDDYPPDVRSRFGPIGERARRQRAILSVVFLAILAVGLLRFVSQIPAAGSGAQMFARVFLGVWAMLMVFNLFDLVILDWLILIRFRPKRIILPGTEGLPGYNDYWFPFRGFLIGIGITLVVSLVVAGIDALVLRLIA